MIEFRVLVVVFFVFSKVGRLFDEEERVSGGVGSLRSIESV